LDEYDSPHRAGGLRTTRDVFDDISIHLVASVGGRIIAVGRLTEEPPSVLQTWSDGKAPCPSGRGVIDLSRFVVSTAFRRIGLLKLLLSETVLFSYSIGVEYIVGAVESDAHHLSLGEPLGFEKSGAPILYRYPPLGEALCQTLVCRPRDVL